MQKRIIDLVKATPIRPNWRDSISSFMTATKLGSASLPKSAINVINLDRVENEKYACRFKDLSDKHGKVRNCIDYTLKLDVTPTPFWGVKKDGILIPGVYRMTVRAPSNRNGIKAAFSELVRGLQIVRPDGSVVIDLASVVKDSHHHTLWAYYNRYDTLPKDGVAFEVLMKDADIESVANVFGTTTEIVNGRLATRLLMKENKELGLTDNEPAILRSGDVLTMTMNFTCTACVEIKR